MGCRDNGMEVGSLVGLGSHVVWVNDDPGNHVPGDHGQCSITINSDSHYCIPVGS